MVVTFVLEEGLPTSVLEAEVRAMAAALQRAGVAIVGGDTKVVERGKADGMYITTTGIGRFMPQVTIDASVRPCRGQGDAFRDRSAITALLSFWPVESWILKRICAPTHDAFCRWWRRWPGGRRREFAGCAIPRAAVLPRTLNELARDCGLGIVLLGRRNSDAR